MKSRNLGQISTTLCCLLFVACSSPSPNKEALHEEPRKELAGVACTEPRPTVCHKALRPVCATRDNGVRCVTTPCDSTEEKSYANECLACADPAVYRFHEGSCSDEASER